MTVCRRRCCDTHVEVSGDYCSDQCRSITEVVELYDGKGWEAVMGRGAAVNHSLPWLDARHPDARRTA